MDARPVNYHLSALKKLGMKYEIKQMVIFYAKSNGRLKWCKNKFSKNKCRGSTENTILAASLANGKTILKNCAIEPEIKDLTNFLNAAGAKIKWSGRTCSIHWVLSSLKQTQLFCYGRQNRGRYILYSCYT